MNRTVAWSLVSAQFVLLALLLFLPHGALWPVGPVVVAIAVALFLVAGAVAITAVAALGPALTASPIPRENARLVTTGAFAFARHPIYTALLSGGAGLLLLGASWWHALVWLGLAALLSAKSRWEERMLAAKYPEYAAYAARVGRFVPGVGRIRPRE